MNGTTVPSGGGPKLRRGFLAGTRSCANGGVVGVIVVVVVGGASGMPLLSSLMTGIWPTETSEARDPARAWNLGDWDMLGKVVNSISVKKIQ